jgi:hypothetical protein
MEPSVWAAVHAQLGLEPPSDPSTPSGIALAPAAAIEQWDEDAVKGALVRTIIALRQVGVSFTPPY